jgi:phosphatidyl-myo-inositol alpha-mannosyltransferase
MRVALVSPYDLDVAGGVQSHVVSLAAALRALGDDVTLLGPGADADDRIGVGGSVLVPANGSRAPVALGPGVFARVRAALRDLRPDVVHVHEPLVPLVGWAAATTDVAPVVLTFHAFAERGALAPLYRAVRPIARRIIGRAAAMTAVSAVAAGFHARALGIDAADVRIVPNGVDVARFAAAPSQRGERPGPDGATVLFVGRLEHRKGVDVALQAFLLLAEDRPLLRLRIVGDGPGAAALERSIGAAPADLRSRIERSGRVTNDVLPAVLAQADVMVVPSRGGESFGIVLLEAMAAGAPLVASDLAGYRAVARDGREALLVPPDAPSHLAAAVARLLDDAELRDALVRSGRQRAAGFDWASIAERTRAVHSEAAARGGSSPRPR